MHKPTHAHRHMEAKKPTAPIQSRGLERPGKASTPLTVGRKSTSQACIYSAAGSKFLTFSSVLPGKSIHITSYSSDFPTSQTQPSLYFTGTLCDTQHKVQNLNNGNRTKRIHGFLNKSISEKCGMDLYSASFNQ